MSWWFKTRKPSVLIISVALYGLALLVAGGASLPLPRLLDPGASSTPIHVFVPLLLVAGLQRSSEDRDEIAEATAVRQVRRLDVALISILVLVGMLISALAHAASASDQLMAGRNLIGYVGLALLARRWFGPRAMTIAALIVAGLAGPLGARQFGDPEPWAFPIQPSTSMVAFTICVVLFGCGIVGALIRTP